jgi:CBS domain-containing protein
VKNFSVKELMVPLSEYATVSEGATLFEAVLALEKAQEEFDHTKYRHRGVLILNQNGQVVGKLGQLDVLQALEPRDENDDEISSLAQFGFSSSLVRKLRKDRRLLGAPLKNLCSKATRLKVEDCMQAVTEGEHVSQDDSLDIAIHQLVTGNHPSLLVTNKNQIVGILRLSDVFAAVFHAMKECEFPQSEETR